MKRPDYPKDDEIRAALLQRSEQFALATGMSKSAIGKNAVNDPAFFPRVAEGRNFTVDTYKRAMDWLDNHWPKAGAA